MEDPSATTAAAAHKVLQRKMTDFMKSKSSGGAGELPSGPCGPAARTESVSASPSLTEEVAQVIGHLRGLQEQQKKEQTAAQLLLQTAAGVSGTPGAKANPSSTGGATAADGGEKDEDEGGWQTWTNRKNRRIGESQAQREQEERQKRSQTPFQLPGQQQHHGRGYYTSAWKRNQAAADQRRTNKGSPVAALNDRQWFWFKKRLCLGCGMDHQVKDCPDLTKEEGHALIRAALNCPEDMRPQGRGSGSGRGARARDTRRAPMLRSSAPAPAAAAAASQPAQGAQKRTREAGPETSTGLTPEAKRTKQFSEAVKTSLILYVREKDGSALTEERYLSLRSSFAYYVEDMLTKKKDPPICAGRWSHSRSVVRIPMSGEEDLLWMRCFLDKAYLVQSEEEYNRSKGKVYVAYLRDRLEPEFTGMRPDKLASFVKYYKEQTKIDGLFDLKMAAKTPKGKAVHVVMDEKAEETFIKFGCKIPFASAGWVSFEDRATYVARIKEQERRRLQPRPSELQKGLLAQEISVEKMVVVEEDDDDVVEVGRASKGEPEKRGTQAKELAKELQKEVHQGRLNKDEARSKFLEQTGLDLDTVVPRRTTSGSSWTEEVELAKELEIPEAVSEEQHGGADEEDQARFELQQEQQAQVHHRAEGSAGVGADGAVSSS